MPRRREVPKRKVLPDPKYGSELLTKFVNMLMRDGKRSVAERIAYGALDRIQSRGAVDPLETLQTALDNVRPVVEVKSRRVGGARSSPNRFAITWPTLGEFVLAIRQLVNLIQCVVGT